ncbi:MAG: OB-fold nucleic acid binding domain-containing protein [Bacteroidales bacterium]|nr:OB-fold nucleic acid binding domain-containing protein [Bacteroidales bacterium]
MKIAHNILTSMALAVLCVLFASCNWQQDVAPMPIYDGEANTTIAELLAMHTIGSLDSYDHLSEDSADIIISGIVTSSDEQGNCYKYINIEDSTGGIQIKINSSTLFNKYRLGQRVYVKCNGLDLGDYRRLPQMGIWANGKMESIPSNKAYQYIYCDGPCQTVEPFITLTSVPAKASELPAEYFNRLVRLEGATFEDGGHSTYSDAAAATSHNINMSGGGTVVLRTSNYANFRAAMLPEGTGTVVGILTRYNDDIQMVIRDLNDVQGFVAPPHFESIFTVNYPNAFNEGWTQTASGNEWNVLSNTSFNGFYITANGATDSWLMSPAINLSNVQSSVISFTHRAPSGGDNTMMKLYYSANGGTDWIEVPISEFSTSETDFTFNIPTDAQSSQFRFAYRFTGNSKSWYISSIAISALVTK